MHKPDEAQYASYTEVAAAKAHSLRRTAYLMCGNWHQAEDLVQMTFIKLYVAWGKVNRDDSLDAYLRHTLLRTCLDEKRRGWFRREAPTPAVPEVDDRAATQSCSAASGRDQLVSDITFRCACPPAPPPRLRAQ